MVVTENVLLHCGPPAFLVLAGIEDAHAHLWEKLHRCPYVGTQREKPLTDTAQMSRILRGKVEAIQQIAAAPSLSSPITQAA